MGQVGVYVLNEAIPKMRIPDITQPINNGEVVITDSRMTGYQPATRNNFRLIAPNKFRLDIQNTAAVFPTLRLPLPFLL